MSNYLNCHQVSKVDDGDNITDIPKQASIKVNSREVVVECEELIMKKLRESNMRKSDIDAIMLNIGIIARHHADQEFYGILRYSNVMDSYEPPCLK